MGFTHLFPLQLKCEKKNEGFENFMYEMAKNLLPVKKKVLLHYTANFIAR